MRVSLTASPVEEIKVGREILKGLGLLRGGVTITSCPTCGRTETNVIAMAKAVNRVLTRTGKPIKVAVMGCVVNGPGEARDADVGIACGKGKCAIFRKGKVIATVDERDSLKALLDAMEQEIHR